MGKDPKICGALFGLHKCEKVKGHGGLCVCHCGSGWVRPPSPRKGIDLPAHCLRDMERLEPCEDCHPLSQTMSEDDSYICAGLNSSCTEHKFRVCWKSERVDDVSHWGRRDVLDLVSVLSQALSVDANMEENESDKASNM